MICLLKFWRRKRQCFCFCVLAIVETSYLYFSSTITIPSTKASSFSRFKECTCCHVQRITYRRLLARIIQLLIQYSFQIQDNTHFTPSKPNLMITIRRYIHEYVSMKHENHMHTRIPLPFAYINIFHNTITQIHSHLHRSKTSHLFSECLDTFSPFFANYN